MPLREHASCHRRGSAFASWRSACFSSDMARGIWTGALSFGLVNIPVEVHTAVRDHRPHFRLLHAKDRSPISYERVCQKEGEAVAWGDLVKGYEYEKGRFVVLTKEDFTAAALEKTRRIDILDFVEASAIDDCFFDTPYYLTPGKGGDVAYGLLREAIRESGRIGIAKFIMREVQHLAAVEVVDEALVLSTLRFADELVDTSTLKLPKRVTGQEEGARHGDVARREPGRRVEAGEVHRRLPRQLDAGHQGEDEGQAGGSGVGRAASRGQGGRSDGAAASEPRHIERPSRRWPPRGQ